MRKRRKEPLFELGRYWLERVQGSHAIYRFWYDERDQRVRRRSTGVSDLEEAKRKLAELVINRAPDDAEKPEDIFVTTVLEHYWTTHSDATPGAKQARRAGALMVEWLVDVQKRAAAHVSDFSIAWQQAFIRWCATDKNHAVGTIARNMKVIAAAMNHATKRIIVLEDSMQREVQLMRYPLRVIYKPAEISVLTAKPEPEPRDWLPTWEQLASFIDGIGRRTNEGEWDQTHENLFRYIVIALNTWARPSAILELSIAAQVDFKAGLVRLNPPGRKQTKKVRPAIPLTDNLRGWLEDWNIDHPIHRNNISLTTIKKVFKRHALKVGMPRFTPYTLRHFMATNIRRVDGCSVSREQRQEWLGHKRQDTTSWYEHHDPEWLREAQTATDKILVRLDTMLKARTLLPLTSQVPLKTGASAPIAPKLVISND